MLWNVAKISIQTNNQYLTELVVNGESYGNTFRLREDILIEKDGFIVLLNFFLRNTPADCVAGY